MQNRKWAGLCSSLCVRALRSYGRGAAAERKSPRIGISKASAPLPLTRAASRHSGRVCASLATSREKTLSLSGDIRGKTDRLPALAAELVRLKVDIIVTAVSQATRPAKEATTTIPIVMCQDPDPVGNGFVASLARPGGNITGLSSLGAELSRKTAGVAQRDRSQALPRGRARHFRPTPGTCRR